MITAQHRFPEEVKRDAIDRAVDIGRRRRLAPYPECSAICPVFHCWGEPECRQICWHKFKEAKS